MNLMGLSFAAARADAMRKISIQIANIVSCLLSVLFLELPSKAFAQTDLDRATVVYRRVDGNDLLADIYRPKGDKVVPVIVWLHGGALILGNRGAIDPGVMSVAQDEGYALVSIDYRLAPETKLPAIISDVESAFTWLASADAERFHLDVGKMVVVGSSAGGYLTLVTGYRAVPKPRALVSLYGFGTLMGEWFSKPSTRPIHNQRKISAEEAARQTDGTVISDSGGRRGDGGVLYAYYRQNGLWPQEVSGFDAGSLRQRIAAYEPARNVTRNYPPTLLIHGAEDQEVPYQESEKMAAELVRHGVPHKLRLVGGAGHDFSGGDPAQVDAAYKTMRDFIVKYLGAD